MNLKLFDRRRFLLGSTLTAGAAMLAGRLESAPRQEPAPRADLEWFDVRDWGIEGRGWPAAQMDRYFDRLPSRARQSVREEVWNLSRDSAGMLIHFQTGAEEIHVRYELLRDRIAMPHMPATGVSGVDLYIEDPRGRFRWAAVARPQAQQVEGKLIDGLPEGKKNCRLYLPLYNGIETIEIGVPRDAPFEGVPARSEKPLLFYGTSITHGACASRPGMPHPAILGRRLNRPVINLGFSGNGRMEAEVGAFLAELDPSLYIIDCLPNMNADTVRERAEPLVRQLRQARPRTPILLVEDRSFTNAWIQASRRDHHAASRVELRKAYDRLQAEGFERLHYLEGEGLLGADGEGATDGSHPSDLGFMRQADAFEPAIRRALGR